MSSVLANEFVGVTTLSSKQCTINIYIYTHSTERKNTLTMVLLNKKFYMTEGNSLFLSLFRFRLRVQRLTCRSVTQKLLLCVSTRVFTGNNGARLKSGITKSSSINVRKVRKWLAPGRLSLLHTMWKSLSLKFLMSLGFMQTSPAALSVLGWTKIVLFSSSHSAYCTDTFRKPSIQQSDKNTRLSAFMQ